MGYIMYIISAVIEIKEDGTEKIATKKKHQRIIDSKYGDQFFVKDGAREIPEFIGFDWDAAISHVNGMISKAEAYANS